MAANDIYRHQPVPRCGVSNVTVVSPGVHPHRVLAVAGQQPGLGQRTMMMERPEVTRSAIDAAAQRQGQRRARLMIRRLAESTRLTIVQ